DALFGAVADRLGVALEPAPRVAQSGEGAGDPQPGAVLAHQPAVVEGAAGGGRRAHLALRLAAAGVLRREEAGVGPAEDFGLGVAEEALGPGVPAGHAARRVEREDGAVGRVL